jgi:hypothetical protein
MKGSDMGKIEEMEAELKQVQLERELQRAKAEVALLSVLQWPKKYWPVTLVLLFIVLGFLTK